MASLASKQLASLTVPKPIGVSTHDSKLFIRFHILNSSRYIWNSCNSAYKINGAHKNVFLKF